MFVPPWVESRGLGELLVELALAIGEVGRIGDLHQCVEIPFPAVYPDRVFSLTTLRAVIGRRSASRGINPEIDLSGAPEDPGVSHMHAVLVGSPEGGWTLIDPGSANGTFLNDSTDPIDTNKAVPVADGDRIHMGAWTTLTLRRT